MLPPIYCIRGNKGCFKLHSSWTNIEAGLPQGSILGALFFLIYINDLSDGLTANPILFADANSLFSVIYNITVNSDLMKIGNLVFQWKMRFNPHPNKQAQEAALSRKINKIDHAPLYFN